MSDGGGLAGSIREVLVLVEKHGPVVLPSRSVEALASPEARGALHVAGVLVAAPSAATWPCDVRGCSREIRANHDGARKPLVAVCCQTPSACGPVELGFDDVAHQEILVDVLAQAACGLLGAVVDRASLSKLRQRHALGEARLPLLVATIAAPPGDVFWAGSPRDTDLVAFCARRERVTRRTLVLVPTSDRVPVDVASRFAPGEQVEVRALADILEVRDGALALCAGRPTIAPRPMTESPPEPAPRAPHGIAGLLGISRWEDMRLAMIDPHTIRIEANGRKLLRTFVELGFVDGRKADVVTPVRAWHVLLLFCKKGTLRPSEYASFGKAFGVKKALEVIGKAMCPAFGLEGSPIRRYDRLKKQWTARFRIENPGAGEGEETRVVKALR